MNRIPVNDIRKALEAIIHPESRKNIVELGLVKEIVSDNEGISVTIDSPRPNDPFISSLKSVVVRALKDAFGPDTIVRDVKVPPKVTEKPSEKKPEIVLDDVKNIIAVASGKGGVGKSTVAVNLSIALAMNGYATGLLDADIFGPSIPLMFNALDFRPEVIKNGDASVVLPLERYGVRVLSTGFFVDPDDAVVWRGPMASNFLKQMLTMAEWGELDYLIIDLTPGTSDIHLSLVQEVAVTGAIIVSTPQQVALADAVKGIAMFRNEKIDVPVIGLVENMSWFTPEELPGNRYYIFGREGCKALSEKTGIPLLGQIPIVQGIRESGDSGRPAVLDNTPVAEAFRNLAEKVAEQVAIRNRDLGPTKRVNIN